MTLIVQLSDPHVKSEGELLYGRIDTQGFLERAVAHVNGLDPRPDIAPGDGRSGRQGRIRGIREPEAPAVES